MNKFLLFLFISYIIQTCFNLCRMKQDCDVSSPSCIPSPANDTNPTTLIGPDVVCPEYNNQLACCNNGQNILLKNNFASLDSLFGTKYGGCDICSINLKRFWCHFTCHPEQHKFMNISGYGHYIIDNVNYTLLMVNMTLNSQMNCDLFNSCKKTKYASQVVAMANAIGFTTFQGTEAYRKSPVFISMDYAKEGGLTFDIDPCNTESNNGTLRGFPVNETCKCNSCDKSCTFDIKTSYPVFQGFSILQVSLFYSAVILLTIVIYICKCYYRKKNPNDHSRSSSMDSEDGVDLGLQQSHGSITNNSNANINYPKTNASNL